ncbi:helix-turn-helix domain-containing protein [Nonomuraea angiospora]|uniref:helix-turn-helix domain-containing protein n=1 Tax=Nonomuraea angiospora TaxID=46172 RepID=UPI00340BFFC0
MPARSRSVAPLRTNPLLALPAAERDRLLETLGGRLETDGTTTEVARRLYRHRNTVINHLHRVEELCGISLSRPRDVATLAIALRSLHHHGVSGPGGWGMTVRPPTPLRPAADARTPDGTVGMVGCGPRR